MFMRIHRYPLSHRILSVPTLSGSTRTKGGTIPFRRPQRAFDAPDEGLPVFGSNLDHNVCGEVVLFGVYAATRVAHIEGDEPILLVHCLFLHNYLGVSGR